MTPEQMKDLEALLEKWSDRAIECKNRAKKHKRVGNKAMEYGEHKEVAAILHMIVDIKKITL